MTTAVTPDILELPAGVIYQIEQDLSGGSASAVFDTSETYRYLLTRVWTPGLPIACWVMLNPSTADAARTDNTLRRVVAFSAAAGCGGCSIVNLFALRSTDPRNLAAHPDPVGPLNDVFLRRAVHTTNGGPVIAGWGAAGTLHGRADAVLGRLRADGIDVHCYGRTSPASGRQPRHPLYLSGDAAPRPLSDT